MAGPDEAELRPDVPAFESSPRHLAVAGVQMLARSRAWKENTARAAKWIGVATAAGAKLVLLPELFAIGSFFASDLPEYAEPPKGRTSEWLRAMAQEHRVTVAGTILERRASGVYNTLLQVESSGRLSRYSKRRLGDLEVQFFAPGREPNVLHTSLGPLGCLICSDGNDRELRRKLARSPIDLVLVPQAIGATVQLGHAVEAMEKNGSEPLWGPIVRELRVPTVTAGLLGTFENPVPGQAGDYLRGGTYVIDADGRGLAHVPFPQEGVAVATVALGREPESEFGPAT